MDAGPLLFCIRLVEASVLGGLVGLERERSGKPAGLRTHVLICVGSALFTQMSIVLSTEIGRGGDPGRVAAQIVTGVGFIGAGTIMQAGRFIHGLTTAATIWVVAALGMTVGAGRDGHALLACALILATLVVLKRIEISRPHRASISLTLRGSPELLVPATLLQGAGLDRAGVRISRSPHAAGGDECVLRWDGDRDDVARVEAVVRGTPGITAVGWEIEP